MYICINTRKVKLTKKISIKELDTILIAYSALVFKDFETSRKVFDKKGNFLGMDYDNFISFLSVDFEKPDKEAYSILTKCYLIIVLLIWLHILE
jgi:hypothetical protein